MDTIVVHYLWTPPQWCDRFPTTDAVVEEVRRWHKARKPVPFSDIGYHFVVGVDGTVAKGRPLRIVGAHVGGKNSGKIGIAYVGGADEEGQSADTRTPEQREALHQLILDLQDQHGAMAVVGHRDLAPSECPGYDAGADWRKWLEERARVIDLPPIRPEPPGLSTRNLGRLREIVRRVREAVRGR